MWIFFPEAALSIVESEDDPDWLVVRAMREGDIEAVFGLECGVLEGGTHYRFRAMLPRGIVVAALAE